MCAPRLSTLFPYTTLFRSAVRLALISRTGEMGYPSALTAKTWGFYDVLFKGKPFEFQRPFGSYVMENVLFKISYPAEFHAQTDRKSTRLNSSHRTISYAVFCL